MKTPIEVARENGLRPYEEFFKSLSEAEQASLMASISTKHKSKSYGDYVRQGFEAGYNAGAASGLDRAVTAVDEVIERLRRACHAADDEDEVFKAMDLGEQIAGADESVKAIRALITPVKP